MAEQPGIVQGASFPGVNQVVSCSYTLAHGVSPSIARLEILPQANLVALAGDLVFYFGLVTLTFRSMKVDAARVQRATSGNVVAITLQDRRWKWQAGGEIYGVYNLRDGLDRAYNNLVRTPQQLAALCLDAMGEIGYDVGQLPNDTFPPVTWEGENPSRALADLCQQFGCRVVLRLDGTVQICRLGLSVQTLLPADLEFVAASIQVPERPDALKVLGAPTRYQNDFVLEPVGIDVDGRIVPIDQLSYKPAAGWGSVDYLFFQELGLGSKARELALQSVWRWYRLTNGNRDGTKPFRVYGYDGPILRFDQVELQDTQNDCFADVPGMNSSYFVPTSVPGQFVNTQPGLVGVVNVSLSWGFPWRPLPAQVFGSYYDGNFGFLNLPKSTPYLGNFKINREEGLVDFGEPMYSRNADNTIGPANIYLRTAALVRDAATWAYDRINKTLVYPGGQWGTGPRVIRKDEILALVCQDYNAIGSTTKLRTNLDLVNAECDYYLAAADAEYQLPTPAEYVYRILSAVTPDGCVHQVTWEVGTPMGASTRVSWGNEYEVAMPSYKDRLQAGAIRAGELQLMKSQIAALRQQRPGR